MRSDVNNISSQRGAALVTALIVLLLLTMIGISAISSTGSELKRANNAQERFRTSYLLHSAAEYVGIDVMQNSGHADYVAGIPKQFTDDAQSVGAPINIPVTGVKAGTATISFKGFTSYANLPGIRKEATHISKGSSDDENPPVYEMFIDITTDANKTAQARAGSVYYPPTGSD